MSRVDICLSKVEFSFEAKNLLDADIFSKSDPFLVLYEKFDDWKEIGRTETILNNLNPVFKKTFVLDYFFEKKQEIRIEVYDRDSKSEVLKAHDFLGYVETTISEIITTPGCRAKLVITTPKKSRKPSYLYITGEELQEVKKAVVMSPSFYDLKKTKLFGSSVVYFTVSKITRANSWVPVYTSKSKLTKVSKSTVLTFDKFTLKSQLLNNGDCTRAIRIDLYMQPMKLIGRVESTLETILGSSSSGFDLLLSGKSVGKIKLSGQEIDIHSFVDYVIGGCRIDLMLGIDFTASNGPPDDPRSLHYTTPNRMSEYEIAIKAVGDILLNYNPSKMLPAFGFGAKLPPHATLSHCFAINGKPHDPACRGMIDVLGAYRSTLQYITFSGPTIFSNIIEVAAAHARMSMKSGQQSYTILYMVTDGVISDMDATIREIVRASDLPLSIVIVGVGTSDFTRMEILDADDTPLKHGGKVMSRDIVQFVPFRTYGNHPEKLAEEVLREIPDQLLSFMTSKGIKPNSPLQSIPSGLSHISSGQIGDILTKQYSSGQMPAYPEVAGGYLPQGNIKPPLMSNPYGSGVPQDNMYREASESVPSANENKGGYPVVSSSFGSGQPENPPAYSGGGFGMGAGYNNTQYPSISIAYPVLSSFGSGQPGNPPAHPSHDGSGIGAGYDNIQYTSMSSRFSPHDHDTSKYSHIGGPPTRNEPQPPKYPKL